MVYREFLFYLEKVGYQADSQKNIGAAVGEFVRWAKGKRISPEMVKDYYQYLSQRPHRYRAGGLSSNTLTRHLYSLRLYFSYLEAEGYLTSHPMSSLRFPQAQTPKREILTLSEINQLYQVCETRLDSAMLSVFYGCGLRRGEGEQLQLLDVRHREKRLYVRKGKGGTRRVVPMSQQVNQTLLDYRAERMQRYARDPLAFFIGRYGGRMRGGSFDLLLKKLLVKTEIQKPVTLHRLRHAIATHLLHGGMPLESVRDFLGHQHLETTQIYTHINESDF